MELDASSGTQLYMHDRFPSTSIHIPRLIYFCYKILRDPAVGLRGQKGRRFKNILNPAKGRNLG
jgi:hypothetical protein